MAETKAPNKTEKTAVATTKTTAVATTDASTDDEITGTITDSEGKQLQVEDLLNLLPEMEEGEKMTGTVLKLEPGEDVRCFLVGKAQVTKLNSETMPEAERFAPAVKLLMQDGTIKICADKVVVGALSGQAPASAFHLICKAWVKTGKGRYRDFDIIKLNPKK